MKKLILLIIVLFASSFYLLAQPVIASFSPTSGPVGTTVTINGANFSTTTTDNVVFFGATRANVTAATVSQLTVSVPVGATYQLISVQTNGLIAYSNAPFIVTFAGDGTGINTNSFVPKANFLTGNGPFAVAIGDLDGDGLSDLVVANYNDATISVFHNTSTVSSISFAPSVDFSVGVSPTSVAIGDLDQDGKPDLAVTNLNSVTVSVLKNNCVSGAITATSFASSIDFTTGSNPRSVAIGDMDGDGRPELIVTNFNSNSVSVFRNVGLSGQITPTTFANKVDFSTGLGPISVAIGDLDGDGMLDIVVGNTNGYSVSVLQNSSSVGGISFNSKVDFTFLNGIVVQSVALGDIDLDGKADMIVVINDQLNSTNFVSVLRNVTTSGVIDQFSFLTKIDFATGDFSRDVSPGDLDGDGKIELAVVNSSANSVSVLKNASDPGSLAFDAKVDFGTGNAPVSISVGDLDGDGKADMVVANQSSDSISVFRRQIIPVAPVASAASSVGQTGFTANWAASSGTTTGYYIDVSTDNFAGPVYLTGYEDLYVGNVTSFAITGLEIGTKYYYRVRGADGVPVSANSNIITATTVLPAPVSSAASAITQTSFSANWSASATATGYTLDVTTDAGFTAHISGSPFSLGNVLTKSITGVTAGTTYYYRVQAVKGTVTSAYSSSQSLLTLPPDPVSSAATGIGQTAFTANWAAATSATGYILEVTTDAGFSAHVAGSPFTLGNVLSRTVTGLSGGTTYYYRVRAVNATGLSGNSSSQSLLTIPPNPIALDASAITQTSLSANWQAAASATGYILDVTTDLAMTSPITGSPFTLGNVLTKNITGLTPGTTYYYQVRAVNGTGTSGNSAIKNTITIPPDPIPTPATGITTNSFQATWNASTGAAYYIVEVSEDNFLTILQRDSITNQLFADATGLTANTQYKYRIKAGNASGTSGYSNAVSVTTLSNSVSEPTSQPTSIVFSGVTVSSIDVSFTAAAGNPAGYLALMKVGSSPSDVPVDGTNYVPGNTIGTSTVVYRSSGTGFTVSGLSPDVTYYFAIFSYNGTTDTYNYLTTLPLTGNRSTLASEPLSQPTALAFSAITQSGCTLSFVAAADSPDGYLVLEREALSPAEVPVDGNEYTAGSNFGNSRIAYVGNSTTVAVSGLNAGTVYYYDIFSYNGSTGNYNYLSASPLNGNFLTKPATPMNFNTWLPEQTSVKVGWELFDDTDSVFIEVSTTDFSTPTLLPGYPLAVVPVGSLEMVIGVDAGSSPLTPGTNYWIRLRAKNASGYSDYTPVVTALTKPATPVLNPVANTDITQTSAILTWQVVTGVVDNYLLDVSQDGFQTFISGFNGLTVTGTSVSIAGIAPGNTYEARLRSKNSSGQSPNSAIVDFLTIPPDPVATTASGITTNSFQATWNAANGANYYILEVTTDDFVNIIHRDSITGQLFADVGGLAAAMQYKYRVKAGNSSGVSGYSNIVPVTTDINASPLAINTVYSTTFDPEQTDLVITASVNGGLGNYTVTFKYKGLLADTWSADQPITPDANGDYLFTVASTMLDDLGVEFTVTVTDGTDSRSATGTITKAVAAATSPTIPFELFGGSDQTWNLFSVPYDLDNKAVGSIFADYDPGRHEYDWRIVRYRNNSNDYVNFNTGQIQLGEAYWFNAKEDLKVQTGAGQVTTQLPFTKSLAKGWNLIGNPYPVNISWNQVLLDNPTVTGVERLQVFKGRTQSTGDVLTPFSGGFVWSDDAASITIDPRTANTGGRISINKRKIEGSDIDRPEWLLELVLVTDGTETSLGGFGMHPEASILKDRYDVMSVPRFMVYTDMYTEHTAYFYPWFATDVVPTARTYSWDFTLASNQIDNLSSLRWDQESLQGKEAKLYLLDKRSGKLIDMSKQEDHLVDLSQGDFEFEIYYTVYDDVLLPTGLLLGTAYPNPAHNRTTIPVVLPASGGEQQINLAIYDVNGALVTTIANGIYAPGIYEFTWEIGEHERPVNGLFIYRLRIENSGIPPLQKKIIVR